VPGVRALAKRLLDEPTEEAPHYPY
jgi:hypothetical protein